jgi:hypothetical protein
VQVGHEPARDESSGRESTRDLHGPMRTVSWLIR